MTADTAPLLILIDGHSLAFRAYHAFAHTKQGPLRTSTGIPTSVCFGFLNSLLQVIESQQPQCVIIAFDRKEPSFRHQLDPNYKGDRKETPEEFIPDLENLKLLLSALNLQIVTVAGYEADDILGTLALKASQANYKVKIVTGDRDLFQLVDAQKKISVLYLEKNAFKASSPNGYTEVNPAEVEQKLGVKPNQVVDYKALCGDKSDSIPGILGIGEKTAVTLLKEYGTLEGIYQNLESIKGALKKKLETGEENAKHSRILAQLALDVPVEFDFNTCQLKGFELETIRPLLEKLELKKFIQNINRLQEKFGGVVSLPSQSNESQQLSLFPVSGSDSIEQVNQTESITKLNFIEPQLINTSEKLTQLVKLLKQYTNPAQPVAWDTETTSLEPKDTTLVGIGCCWGEQPTEVAYIPLNHTEGEQLPQEEVLSALSVILESENYPKVFQNTKFDRIVLLNKGIKLAGVVFDTMLASYVLRPELSHKLSDLCERYLENIKALNYRDLEIPKTQTIAHLSLEKVAHYCGMDAYATFMLVPKLIAELKQAPDLYELLLKVEQPLEPVLAEMENTGVCIDTAYLNQLSQQLEQDLQILETKAYEAAGESFNLGSPKQLSEILFEKLGLNKRKSRKLKTGYSTDHATLEKLQGDHPIIDYILEHRTLAKLKSTYVDALPALVHPQTGRVHTDFNQAVTTTGRLSSSNPNLQNIPIRTEFSRQIRKAFITQDDWLLVSADYSQIELRILAHLSQEPVLLEAYQNYQDVHRVTAQLLFDKEVITSEERSIGKTINFGVIYGMGAQRFARSMGLSFQEGKDFIDKYHQKYARVFEYLERVKKEAIAKGFVTTIKGRRRYFEFFDDKLNHLRGEKPENLDLDKLNLNYSDAQLLRAAANAPIQGSSADIIKIAMVQLHEILQHYQARLLLQVHDELVFEIPPDEWEDLQVKIKDTMENAVKLTVPLVVDIRSGKNWMEAK
ncbi:DNA polymerase I [Gloeothece citriformis PCC 7424]|uniref:DNA polymerase I n=1 Tax=Gloeothece citriformis (strain PCC 7424) TaxID=65393 RepID=B7KLM9_GLOC7|nr:DNA polymerase I [Gloeothece citriformis]ACK72601.1 DNA polymerase I [Gloeothece citriformis PCC 7424]